MMFLMFWCYMLALILASAYANVRYLYYTPYLMMRSARMFDESEARVLGAKPNTMGSGRR